jgi:hypothetical protein
LRLLPLRRRPTSCAIRVLVLRPVRHQHRKPEAAQHVIDFERPAVQTEAYLGRHPNLRNLPQQRTSVGSARGSCRTQDVAMRAFRCARCVRISKAMTSALSASLSSTSRGRRAGARAHPQSENISPAISAPRLVVVKTETEGDDRTPVIVIVAIDVASIALFWLLAWIIVIVGRRVAIGFRT